MKRLVVCLDGTWNNPYREKERVDGSKVLKPANPLKTARAVIPMTQDGVPQITYYDAGVGALNSQPGTSRANVLLRWVDSKLGGAWGAGFEGNIQDAYEFLARNYVEGDDIFVFGFSRGAGEARGLCRFIDWMGGFPKKNDIYYVPTFFRFYLDNQGGVPSTVHLDEINARKATKAAKDHDPLEAFVSASIRFLGAWDTVLALGAGGRRSFHAGEEPPACVENVCHAISIDERRIDFRPVVWKKCRSGQSLTQKWFPGVHSNVGGGYVNDGLANGALKWILSEAESLGLELDWQFLDHYKPHSGDTLYDSKTFWYRVREVPLLWKRHKGVRAIQGACTDSGCIVHESAFERLEEDPDYRPRELLRYIATDPASSDRAQTGQRPKLRN